MMCATVCRRLLQSRFKVVMFSQTLKSTILLVAIYVNAYQTRPGQIRLDVCIRALVLTFFNGGRIIGRGGITILGE